MATIYTAEDWAAKRKIDLEKVEADRKKKVDDEKKKRVSEAKKQPGYMEPSGHLEKA